MNYKHWLRGLVLTVVALSTSSAEAGSATIEVWTRGRATGPGDSARVDVRIVDLDRLPLVEARLADVQYGGLFTYRGLELQTVIDGYHPPAEVDLALLHFANGMQIPLSFRDAGLVTKLHLFLAHGMRRAPGEALVTGSFPSISRPRAGFVDVRPIQFGPNKLVVGRRDHPVVPDAAQAVFSPWLHVDSLTGIELVSSKAYYAQFDVDPDPTIRAGLRLYTESCQFCHGARHVGAMFGWDFVEPTPMYSYRGAKNLFYHVKYKPLDASAKGLLMPALSHMSEQDAASVWRWLRAVATNPMPAYAPAAIAK